MDEKQDFHYHIMAEIEKRSWPDVMEDIIKKCLFGITMRKKGIADKAYLAPLTTDDCYK